MRRVIVFVAAVLISAFLVSAQEATGSISGTVSDPSGVAIAGAVVTATNVSTKASRRLITDEQGSFRASTLPPGRYEVSISKEGFKATDLTGLDLQVNQVLKADAQM